MKRRGEIGEDVCVCLSCLHQGKDKCEQTQCLPLNACYHAGSVSMLPGKPAKGEYQVGTCFLHVLWGMLLSLILLESWILIKLQEQPGQPQLNKRQRREERERRERRRWDGVCPPPHCLLKEREVREEGEGSEPGHCTSPLHCKAWQAWCYFMAWRKGACLRLEGE